MRCEAVSGACRAFGLKLLRTRSCGLAVVVGAGLLVLVREKLMKAVALGQAARVVAA